MINSAGMLWCWLCPVVVFGFGAVLVAIYERWRRF